MTDFSGVNQNFERNSDGTSKSQLDFSSFLSCHVIACDYLARRKRDCGSALEEESEEIDQHAADHAINMKSSSIAA